MSDIIGNLTSASIDGFIQTSSSVEGNLYPQGPKGDPGNGINRIEKTNTVGLVDTYTIYFDNGTTKTFTVTNGQNGTNGVDGKSLEFKWQGTQLGVRLEGESQYSYVDLKGDTGDPGNGISRIEKTDTSGLIDTYTIYFTNGTTSTFTVTNANAGSAYTKSEVDQLIEESGVVVSPTEPSSSNKHKIWIKHSENLIDISSITSGYRLDGNGALYSASTFFTSDYIEVLPSTDYCTNISPASNKRMCEYDANKTFITGRDNANTQHITTGSTTKYIRVAGALTELDSAVVQKGVTASIVDDKEYLLRSNNTYEEYNVGNVIVKSTEPVVGERKKVWKQHSKNLFDKNQTPFRTTGSSYTILSTGIRAIVTESTYTNANILYQVLDVNDYIGKTLTLSAHAKSSSTNKGFMYMRLTDASGNTSDSYPAQNTAEVTDADLSKSYTIPSGIGNYHYLRIALYSTRQGATAVNNYVDYTNLQLEVGSSVTSYEGYTEDKEYILNDNNVYEEFNPQNEIYNVKETIIGTFLGKPLYRKVIDFETLPNATTKSVNHNISNLQYIVTLRGFTKETSGNKFPIPHSATGAIANQISIWANSSQVTIQTGIDRTGYSAYVILEYTKTTD